ncbi:HD domain-containing protein [Oceanimonas sp. NS1]|nr:HD domain-containing protein [Oceanimonas sp. NS1]
MSRYEPLIRADRLHPEPHAQTPEQAIEADRARIVQCSPVRRLQQKTQVFPLDVKASVRSRLTHSLEVKETGRQLALRVVSALDDQVDRDAFVSLVEMACLLHDVGNPPLVTLARR